MRKKLIKAVIFDQDGLMFDSERLVAEGWAAAGKSRGYTIDEGFLETIRGRSPKEIKAVFELNFGAAVPYDAVDAEKRRRTCAYAGKYGVPVKGCL